MPSGLPFAASPATFQQGGTRMQKRLIQTALACFLLFLCSSLAQANVNLSTKAELKKFGVDFNNFQIISFSPDGKSLLGFQKNSPADISKGRAFTFVNLKLNSNGKITSSRTYTLPLKSVEQTCFTPDSKSIVIVSHSGACIDRLDLEDGKITHIMAHFPGEKGFRSFPPVLTLDGDKMLASGYIYDENDVSGKDALYFLDPYKQKLDAFTLITDVHSMEKKLKAENSAYPNRDFIFFGHYDGKKYHMYRWTGIEEETRQFDEGKDLVGYWCNAHRMAYGIQRDRQSYDLMLYDAKTNEKIPLIEGSNVPYKYVFLSGNGKTVVANQINPTSARTSLVFSSEENNWATKPIEGLDRSISIGKIRLSNDGKKMAFISTTGLRIIDLK